MNGVRFAEDIDEAIDDEAYDDESYRSAEFDLLGTVGKILDPIGIVPAIGKTIFGGGGSPARPPLPQVQIQPTGPGVSTANLTTPGGNATLRLPEPVVTREEFRQITDKLEETLNRTTARLNTTQSDLTNAVQRLSTVETDTRNKVGELRTFTRRSIERAQREQREAATKLRKDINSQATTSMMMSMLMQQGLQSQLQTHTHSGVTTGSATTGTATGLQASNSALMFLPMMMMGSGDSGSSDNNMMTMMMMMMMSPAR